MGIGCQTSGFQSYSRHIPDTGTPVGTSPVRTPGLTIRQPVNTGPTAITYPGAGYHDYRTYPADTGTPYP
ncbi:MAG: hypothetical protein HZA49_09085 [Planctomycetes bacterium]|nr:hypothetical protein [Planctomycetota bacterium]